MAASRAVKSSWRICRRYKIFFCICLVVLSVQLYLGYSFYQIGSKESISKESNGEKVGVYPNLGSSPKTLPVNSIIRKSAPAELQRIARIDTSCTKAKANEAQSAASRAKSSQCQAEIIRVACLNENHTLYPLSLPRFCSLKGNHTFGEFLGCYKDDQSDRDLSNFNTQFLQDNSPLKCINYCLNGGYQYASVQYKHECWCGRSYGKHGTLPDTSCNSLCPGNQSETCGGYNAHRVFSTGLPVKKAIDPPLVSKEDISNHGSLVHIVFVLTVNGRAVRQVKRLLTALYNQHHYFYIHVDSRSSYMYRELLNLESRLPNVRLSRERFATIWGGASLLQGHLTLMKSLLNMSDWHWDYYINLSETDYPFKTVDQLTKYLTAYKGKNFLKSHGRETPEFIRKQGLNHLFYECENHLWRLGKCPLPEGILYDGGSDWVALYRDFVSYSVNSEDKLVTGLKEMFKYTLLPVEAFFHTLLLNSEFCETMANNNLHFINWRRKQGCKCQHKKQVDWCGCSPNVFRTEDLERFLKFKERAVFFARKLEPTISVDIINQLDIALGKDFTEIVGLSSNWYNDFHHLDPRTDKSDLWLTFMHSLVRRTRSIISTTYTQCQSRSPLLIESHVLNVADSFYRYVIKYNVTFPGHSNAVTQESQYSYRQHYKVINPTGPIGRLVSLEVGTDFDPKELLFRNYAKCLGPESEVRLRYVWRYGNAFTVAIAWIDPAGVVASYQDVTVGTESFIDAHNPNLNTPLRPGVWTVKILYALKVSAQVQFLVLPFSMQNGSPLTTDQAHALHNGPSVLYSHTDYSNFREKVGINNADELNDKAKENGYKTGTELEEWIDALTVEFWSVQDMCATEELPNECPQVDSCVNTKWSSLSPDPKNELLPNLP